MNLILSLQINIKLLYKLVPLILVDMAWPAQITQNSKFSKFLQYLKKEVKDKVDYFCNQRHSFL